MTAPGRKRVIVTDATVLINLIHVDRLGLLGALSGYEFVVPPEVEAEVSVPAQAGALTRGFDVGHIARAPFTGMAELETYTELVEVLGKGEAACLAMAIGQGWYVGVSCRLVGSQPGRFRA